MAERRLAAIMFTDIVGYTALMAESEETGLAVRERHRALVRPLVERYHGESIEARGDESLSTFPTALDAVNCALAFEEQLRDDAELKLHVGIHLGDLVVQDGEVSGDGVNIASRICALSEGGGLCVSGEVHRSVRNQPGIEITALGERTLKNVPEPVSVYAITGTPAPPPAAVGRGGRSRKTALRATVSAVAALVMAAAALAWWLYQAAPAGPPLTSIAVLPFDDMSPGGDQAYFADGMAEELIAMLSGIPDLRVVARTSAFAFKSKQADVRTIGGQLNVGSVVEGSVRKAGDQLRITAQLIRVSDGYHLWSETYDRELDHVFAIQADIARRVTQALRITLLESDEQRLTTPDTESTEAYDAYLQGLESGRSFQVDGVVAAARHFRRAIAFDPSFARAHAALANAYMLSRWTTSMHTAEMLRVAEPAATTALALDPLLSEAHAASAAVLEVRGETGASEGAYVRALELNPGNRAASLGYGQFLAMRLRLAEAIAVYERALEADPLDSFLRGSLAQAYQAAGRTGEALRTFGKARAQGEANPFGYYGAAFVYFDDLGDLEQAISWWQRSIEVDPEDPELVGWLAHALLTLGDLEQAASLAEQALARDPDNAFLIATLALANERRGDAEQAERLALRALDPASVRRLGGTLIALRVLRSVWLRGGRLADLISAYEASYPILTEAAPLLDDPFVFPHLSPAELAAAAVDLAHLEGASGDVAGKAALLDRTRTVLEIDPRVQSLAFFRPTITPVEILILDDQPVEALDALEVLVDGGWRAHWQWHLVSNPIFDALRGDSRFERLVEVLEQDTRRHRQAVAKTAGG